MEPIVSTLATGQHSSPLPDDHGDIPDLLVEGLAAYEAAPSLRATPELVAEQSRILDAELEAFLVQQGDTAEPRATPSGVEAPALPGFDVLTEADLQLCPAWCIHQDLPVHSDGFDPDPDTALHRGVQHSIHAIHGGEGIDHAGRAELTMQLEQERDLTTGPVITIAIVVKGIEQYAWLTLPETRALHHALGYLLTETDTAG